MEQSNPFPVHNAIRAYPGIPIRRLHPVSAMKSGSSVQGPVRGGKRDGTNPNHFFPSSLLMTPPTTAPPTVPTPLPPVRTAPATAPAPTVVSVSRRVVSLEAETQSSKIAAPTQLREILRPILDILFAVIFT
jgi:hypothetical protein